MALRYRNGEESFQADLRHRHDQGTVFPLGKTAIIKDDPETPAFAALVLEPNGSTSHDHGAVAYTAAATHWAQIAREILRALAPTIEDEILADLKRIESQQGSP